MKPNESPTYAWVYVVASPYGMESYSFRTKRDAERRRRGTINPDWNRHAIVRVALKRSRK